MGLLASELSVEKEERYMHRKKFDDSIKLFIILILITAVDTILMADTAFGVAASSDDFISNESDPVDFAITGDLDEEIPIDDFDENITPSEGSTPTGSSYRLDVHYSGTRNWCDAEKSFYDGDDDLMCWAGTASNVLYWTGWGHVGGMTNCDQMFTYFQDHWTDKGGWCYYGWDWWFDGTPIVPSSAWSSVHDPGGNFWSSTDFNNYATWSSDSANILSKIDGFLHDGYGLGLSIAYYDSGGDRHGHAITCWGFNYDSSYPKTDSRYYKGVWVTDSDDNKAFYDIWPWESGSSAPNKLQYYGVYKSGNTWYLSDYGSNTWEIENCAALGAGPGIAPKVNAGSDKTVNEGSSVSFSGSYTNPGPASGHSFEWDFGDGTAKVTGTKTPSHVFRDNGVYTVTFKVTDEHSDTGSDTLTVTVNNVAPTANAGTDKTVDEGATVSFSGSISDPGALDTHSVYWNFGDGYTSSGTLTPSHVYKDNGVYTVTLTVYDDDGGYDTDTLIVTVNNVAPTVNVDTGHLIDFESLVHGQSVGTYYPGLTFSSGTYCYEGSNYNIGSYPPHSGSAIIANTATGEIRVDFDVPVSMVGAWFCTDTTTVYLNAYDSMGNLLASSNVFSGMGYTKFAMVQASGISYVIFEDTANQWGLDDLVYGYGKDTYDEGAPVSFIGYYSDPGIDDTHSYEWDFGDGSPHVSGTLNPTYSYGDNGVYTVTLYVTDNDGAVGSGTFLVTIMNVAPTVDILTESFAAELITFEEVGHYVWVDSFYPGVTFTGAQCLQSPHYNDYGYPPHSGTNVVHTTGGTLTVTFDVTVSKIGAWFTTYYPVTINAYDEDDNLLASTTIDTGYTNLGYAEIVADGIKYVVMHDYGYYWTMDDLVYQPQIFEGDEVSFEGIFSDPGWLDTHTIVWDFGDGNFAYGTLTPTHAYGDNGVYTVTLTVTDDDGGVGLDTLEVTVYNVAPTVDAGVDLEVDEGAELIFAGSFFDPGFLDTHTFYWDFGDGHFAEGTLTPTHAFADNGIYTVTLTVTDDDGGVGVDTLTVTVYNVAPTASIDSVTQIQWFALEENIIIMLDPANFTGSSYDPGADDLTFTWVWGDGTPNNVTFYPNSPPIFPVEITQVIAHVYTEPGEYLVTLIVEDDDGGSSEATLTITVWGPQDLKRAVISQLESATTNDKCCHNHLWHVIKKIEKSISDKYWINETHLNPKFGVCAFQCELCAAKHLESTLWKYYWCIFKLERVIKCFYKRGWDTSYLELKLEALYTAISFYKSALLKIVKADELIVRVALNDAMNSELECLKFQKMRAKFILKALYEMAKAAKSLEYGCFSKAISHYKLAWIYLQNAMNFSHKCCHKHHKRCCHKH